MPGPVERWLETFMCQQYANLFDAYGFKTLQAVCQIQMSHLQSMGIPPAHCGTIYQNVEVLRQSIQGPMPYTGEEVFFRNRMSAIQNSPYENSDHQQMGSMNMNYNQNMNMHGGYGTHRPMMQQYPGTGSYPQSQQNPPRQSYPMSGFKQEYSSANYHSQMRPGNDMEYSGNCFPRQPNPYQQMAGGPGLNQSNMQHPHLVRNSAQQNPQEVANNILQMASSTYPPNNTVQVPLSKNRSAPYHVPQRSGHYAAAMSPNENHRQQHQQIQQMQFTYPASSPQMHPSPHSTMSPVSPASATVMSSPHSIHSSHSGPSSSPVSMHSPRMGCVRSPGSDVGSGMMRVPEGAVPSMMNQQMNSPQRNQYHMPTPVGTPHSRMVSPVSVNQQLQVSTSSSTPSQFHQNYRDMSNMVSPSGSTSKSHFSSCSNIQASPGGQSVQLSNIGSPYTPSSHTSLESPNQQYTNSMYLMESSSQPDNNQPMPSATQANPLQSLQKLCMLPETRVVDPKSVVNDTCAPSPQNLESFRNAGTHNDYQQGNSGAYNDSGDTTTGKNERNHSLNDTVPGESVQRSEISLQSANNNLSDESSVCDETLNTGATNVINSIQTGDKINPECHENDGMTNRIQTCHDEKLKQLKDKDDTNIGIKEQNNKKQETSHVEAEDIKCQPKKMKLLRATTQTNTSSSVEMESNEKQQLTQTIDEGPQESVTGAITDHVCENPNPENESVTALTLTDSQTKIPVTSPIQINGQMKEVTQKVNAIEDTNEILQIKTDLKEKDSTNVNGEDVPDSGLSGSEEDSHLSVRKDLKTYSRLDRMKITENIGRLRNHSGGSVSDGVIESDIEYEDHIGCDDIENNVSDIDEVELYEMSEDKTTVKTTPEFSSKVSEILSLNNGTEKQVISSPHWKKSKLNDLSTDDKNTQEKVETCNGSRNKGKNGIRNRGNDVMPLNGTVHIDSDEDVAEVPSPGVDVSGVGVETRDGTMFMTQRFFHRPRKTPLKYKDTSFFKGDFLFEDEDDTDYEPKPKLLKKTNGFDFNHNTATGKKVTHSLKNCDRRNQRILTNGGNNELMSCLSVEDKQKKNRIASFRNGKVNTARAVLSGALNRNLHSVCDILTSDTELSEKPVDGTETISKKKGNKVGSNSQQKVARGVTNTSQNTDRKEKGDVHVKTKSVPHKAEIAQASGVINTRLKVSKSDKSKVKQLNGLPNIKETRSKTKNCNFDNTMEVGKEIVRKKKQLSSPYSTEISDSSDDDGDVIIDSKDDDEIESSHAKVSCVQKKTESTKGLKLSKVVCDEKETESDSEESDCSKRVKLEKSGGDQTKPCKEESKSKSRPQVSKKNKIVQKSHKKFLFESDEEFDPSVSSLRGINLNRTQNLLKKNQRSKKQDTLGDFKGPMIRLEGPKHAPDKCVVINERIDTTSSSGKTKVTSQAVATRIHISHLPSDKSVLIPQASVENGNPWLCALCGKHSSYRFLGDLFGPYTVDNSLDPDPGNLTVKPVSKKRKSDEGVHGASKASRTSRRVGSLSKDSDYCQEVWVHESCSVWSDGVFLIGSKIYGLQEAVAVASKTPCTHCLEMGAMIGCLNKGCKEKYHYSCAVEKDCYLDEENFSLLCPRHKVKKLKPPEPSTSASVT